MGRHGGGPAPLPGRRVSTASAGVVVVLVAGIFAVVTVLGLAMLGVPLLPRQAAAAATPTPTPSPTIDQVSLASSPAQGVITRMLGPGVAAGWTPAGAVAWSGGTPFDAPCGRPSVDAVLSGARVYSVGTRQVVLTVSAYTAGSGAVAMRDWAARLGTCATAPVRVSASTVPSSDAFVATLPAAAGEPGATAIFWRRGDVVAVIAVAIPAAPGMPLLAVQADPALVTALTGVCVNQASTVADAARSPWVAREQFVGLASPIRVTTAPSPTPVPPPGLTPVPSTWSPTPLPSVSLPERPADPVWPADLPAGVVESPVPPAVLAPAPTLSIVPSRLDDPVGPGCGWAFTGQSAPPFDAGTEAVTAQGRVAQAREDLAAAQQAWQVSVVSYWQAVADYSALATSYTAYATAVREVARAWDRITAARKAYNDAVDAYNAAVRAREQFLLDQATAQAEYDNALAVCAVISPSASPTDTASPTSTASPTTQVGPQCPPAVPPILSQLPPTLPPIPTLPPDPRPSG
jgi:hypothetical protein